MITNELPDTALQKRKANAALEDAGYIDLQIDHPREDHLTERLVTAFGFDHVVLAMFFALLAWNTKPKP